jgi:hypothetical protein
MTIQYLQEQADRAERLARGVLDTLTCEALMKYARECRERANATAPFATAPLIGPELSPVICSDMSARPSALA